MDLIDEIFGTGRNLTMAQMSCRAVIVFLSALVLIRISGRRSFGLHNPLDNIITILLGAILSRAVVGASPFLPVAISSLVVVGMHRLLGIIVRQNQRLSNLLQGKRILLYEHGTFIEVNMKRALVTEDDVMAGGRKAVLSEDLTSIKKIYMERSGEISLVKIEADN